MMIKTCYKINIINHVANLTFNIGNKSKTLALVILMFLMCLNSSFAQNDFYGKGSYLPCINRTFNVYVHVALDSSGKTNLPTSKINEYLAEANKVFEPICIRFEFCKIDTIVDYSFDNFDDNRELELVVTRFQKKRRINLYFAETVYTPETNSASNFEGVLYANECYLIVPKSGKGLIHELGHSFGLLHTFETENGIEHVDGSNCATAGDLICDTPAEPYNTDKKECRYKGIDLDANDELYHPEIGNYMSHFFCAHCFFTKEQYLKMATNYQNSAIKLW